ncbi:Gfo/Idh/MocA family oxidoreductase [Candidatus Bathyarchaeota archaeon]|nr:Gfo/Idh/MocA family oxidoreductase [Candidatus Bathyarchaeota archaeon]
MKVGLVGCGGIAPSHIKVYQGMNNVKVVGLCDLNLAKAKNLAAEFKIKKTFQNYWDMFENEELNLVDICTPVSTHARIVCDAAKAVPAILVEKPMALSVSECDKMIKEVKKHGSKLCVGHNQIFSPHIQKAKALVDSGAFNLLSFSTIQKESFELLRAHNLAPAWNVRPEQKGIIWEVCCHLAYLQLHFLPDLREVYAVGGKVKYPVYDDFAVFLRAGGQRFGIIELSWVAKETEIVYELRDSAGKRLQIYRDFDYFLEKSESPPFSVGGVVRNFFVDEKRILRKWVRFGLSYFRKRKILPTFNLISNYIKSIEKDLPPPISPEDGRNTINLLECIEKSLDKNRPVEVCM